MDDGKEIVNKIFFDVTLKKTIRSYSRYTSKGAVFQNVLFEILEVLLKNQYLRKKMISGLLKK